MNAARFVVSLSVVPILACTGGKMLVGIEDDGGASTGSIDSGGPGADGGPAYDSGSGTPADGAADAPVRGGPVDAGTVGPAVDGGIAVDVCPLPPDAASRWILFDSDAVAYNRDLYAMRADGSAVVRLTTDPSLEENPTVSPDGRSLAFVSDRTGSKQIYVEDLTTGALTQLTTIPAGADQPSWSSDDTQIAFHSGASVWIMAADGSGQRIVATGLDDFNAYKYPSLSLDGTQVVFDRNNEIDAVHLDGTGQRYVVQNWTTTEETPAVSPDGTLVAFGVVCSGQLKEQEQIAITPFAGYASDPCTPQRITPPTGSARRPAWGPDGVIAFELVSASDAGGSASIAAIVPNASAWCVLVGAPGDDRNPSWAPAGYQPR